MLVGSTSVTFLDVGDDVRGEGDIETKNPEEDLGELEKLLGFGEREYEYPTEGVDDRPLGGTFGATFNLINCILDAGLVGVPYAFAKAGYVSGVILVLVAAAVSCYTLELLIFLADKQCREGGIAVVSYEELGELALGSHGRAGILAAQMLYCFGSLLGYLIVVKDNTSDALRNLSPSLDSFLDGVPYDSSVVTIAVAVVVLFPLCLFRSVASIGHFSAVTICVVVGIIVIFWIELRKDICPGCDKNFAGIVNKDIASTLGICIFAFLCHHNEFAIYRSLGARATPERWVPIVRTSVAFATIAALILGSIVFGTFGTDTESDIFKNYPLTVLTDVSRLLMVLNMLLSFPMNFGVMRETVQVLLTSYTAPLRFRERHAAVRSSLRLSYRRSKRLSMPSEVAYKRLSMANSTCHSRRTNLSFNSIGEPTTQVWSELDRPPRSEAYAAAGGGVREDTSLALHLGTTLPLFLATLGLGLVIPELGPTLDIVGGAVGSFLGFIFPAYIALQLEENPYGGRAACWTMITVGGMCCLLSLAFGIKDFVKP
eukprot:Sspe_Gene.96148::Locus_68597_Transcript_1_1_Confidence_1.000_Length_1724::g.96148::m.96148/K14997/SLC38A11; solute carrier family 38 (sodium-coupled neutral amino acid transporter), member 11